MAGAELVLVSNRGPLSFRFDDAGKPVAGNVGGGLAGALTPLVSGSGATWVASAMSDADRAASAQGMAGVDGLKLRMVDPPAEVYRMAYDVVANATLWFVHHHLFDLSHRPRFDWRWTEAWTAYRQYNALFADAVSEEAAPGATVLVHDYHLCLLPGYLRRARPDLRTVHFSHTPFADPGVLRVLPTDSAREMLQGMSAAGSCGFHTRRWEWGYRAGCTDLGVDNARSLVSPLAPDADALLDRARSADCTERRQRLDEWLGDRKVIVRVDRMEPSKNLLRGFASYDELLRSRPDLRGRVVMLAVAYKSRQALPEYLAYANEVANAASRVNETWGTAGWDPVVLDVGDDPARSLAALTRYDVLLVNPLRDGLNLVAKEGPIVNDHHGVLVLSREAGAFDELAGPALEIHPFDVTATAAALARALDMDGAERRARSQALKEVLGRRTPRDWLTDLVGAAG